MAYNVSLHPLPRSNFGGSMGYKKGIGVHHAYGTSLQGCYNTLVNNGLSTYCAIHHKEVWVFTEDWTLAEWATGDTDGNNNYISCELINEGINYPYPVAEDTLGTFCEFMADKIKNGLFSGGIIHCEWGGQKGVHTTLMPHRNFAASSTACPGDFVYNRGPELAARINQLVNGGSTMPAFAAAEALNNNGLYYSAHVQDLGWSPAAHDGQAAGSVGFGKRLEAIKIDTRKVPGIKLSVKAHVQDLGWKDYGIINHETVIGTVGQAKRLEAVEITLVENTSGLVLAGAAHVQDLGWQGLHRISAPTLLGTTGQAKRMEAFKLLLV